MDFPYFPILFCALAKDARTICKEADRRSLGVEHAAAEQAESARGRRKMEHGQQDKRGLRGRDGSANLRSLNSTLECWPAWPQPKFAFLEESQIHRVD